MSTIKPFYYSWTSQKNAPHFNIDSTDEFHYLSDNKKILDFSSTSFQASFGLKNTTISQSIIEGANTLPLASPKADHFLKEKASTDLLNLINKSGKIFWTNSGAESVENAIKMARHITKKNIIVSRQCSYHGASLGALSIGGDWRTQAVQTIDQWTLRIPEPFDDPKAIKARKIIENYGAEKIAAICLETITGGNGVIIPPKSWYQEIQKICDDYKIHLVLDEVICGIGRTALDFGFQHYPFLKPDFICLAKAITGGFFPMGAVWTSDKISNFYEDQILPCGLTNYAHPIGLSAVVGTLNYYLSMRSEIAQLENLFKTELSKLKNTKNIRQIGLIAAVELDKQYTWNQFLEKDIYLFVNKNLLVLAPALNMPHELLIKGFDIINSVLK